LRLIDLRASAIFRHSGKRSAKPASNCFNGPMISALLCFPFDMTLLLVPQNHIHFPADGGEQLGAVGDFITEEMRGW
jgi:hypothetical protein